VISQKTDKIGEKTPMKNERKRMSQRVGNMKRRPHLRRAESFDRARSLRHASVT